MAEEQGMDLRTLTPQQLQGLGEQLESDVTALQDSLQTLSQAAKRFHQSGIALEELAKQEAGAATRKKKCGMPICVCRCEALAGHLLPR